MAFRTAARHWQQRLETIKNLHLTFLLNAQQSAGSCGFRDNPTTSSTLSMMRTFGRPKRLRAVWLKAKGVPNSDNCCWHHAGFLRYAASISMCSVVKFCFLYSRDHVFHAGITDLSWSPRSRFIHQPVEPIGTNRFRHFPTVGFVTFNSCATAMFVSRRHTPSRYDTAGPTPATTFVVSTIASHYHAHCRSILTRSRSAILA